LPLQWHRILVRHGRGAQPGFRAAKRRAGGAVLRLQAQGLPIRLIKENRAAIFCLMPPPDSNKSPAGASRWGFVFNTCRCSGIDSSSGTDEGGSRGLEPQSGEPAELPCACERNGSPIRPTKQNRAAIFCLLPPQLTIAN
jgi:hypothetical protein